jgi:NitT/TauT family transport system substrate-binding protein
MNRSDDLIVAASQGMPFVIVGAVFQHDPQGLLVHESSPVKTLKDLNGRTVTASVGMTWIPFQQKKHRVTFSLKPNTFGIGAFFADADAIQQCMLTSEPYYAQERGIKVRALPISTSGYDCYHAIFCRRELLQTRPEVVRAFLAASIRGWRDYLEADPEPAHRLILERNPQSSRGLLEYSRSEIIIRSLVIGDATRDEGIGQISLARLMEQQSTLLDLKVLEVPVAINSVATKAFLPPQRR